MGSRVAVKAMCRGGVVASKPPYASLAAPIQHPALTSRRMRTAINNTCTELGFGNGIDRKQSVNEVFTQRICTTVNMVPVLEGKAGGSERTECACRIWL
uniref:Uncharacterized protein n=1 Tax=Ascaris lumbricoides TaxID=6252 RepID=A0A9J2PCV1_ASCLU